MSDFKFTIFSEKHFVDLNLYQYGREHCDPLHSYGPTMRNHYLFHYIISGKGTLVAAGSDGKDRNYSLKAGNGFLIFPGQVTTYQADPEDPWEYTWIEFDGMFAKEAVMLSGLTMSEPVYRSNEKKIAEEMKNTMLTLSQDVSGHSPFRQIGLLYQIIDGFVSSASERRTPSSGHISDYYINEAMNYVEQNFQQDISVESIAEYCGLSRGYLNKIFQKYIGKSPQAFIIQYRMSKAVQLLKHTELSIGDVSKAVGYPNQLHFSRAFKKIYEKSPSQWRKENSDVKNKS